MCHGQLKLSKTVRYKTKDGTHENAIPYKRTVKHKKDYADYRN